MRRRILFVFLFACTVSLIAVTPSGTLPVLYISTHNHQSVSRDYAIDATIYMTAYGEYEALGDAAHPLPITIKGRGNWTWNGFDKKPYKIVFAQGYGQKLLGMHKSKHWALMAGADDYLGFLKNTVGYSLSKHIGLPYTPQQVPVELVLNGDYKGLYFVTETIRVDNDRVSIHEQADAETDPALITGGWLVEIDNYRAEGNIELQEHNGQLIMITPQSPEQLSQVQRNYISRQMAALNDAIYQQAEKNFLQARVNSQQTGGCSLAGTAVGDILDLNDAARFYLVQEIMEDCESYHGSCFLYKDRDTADHAGKTVVPKWHFGPVWDFGNAYDRHQERYIYDHPTFSQIWIGQLREHPEFNERVMQLWYTYRESAHAKVLADIDTFVSCISAAAKRDAQRWQNSNVRTNADMNDRKQEFLSRMNWRLAWLYKQWGEGDSTPLPDDDDLTDLRTYTTDNHSHATVRISNGQLYILRNGHRYTVTGQKME